MDDLPLTQDLHLTQTIPEKPVGFLGVNGVEYPLINGVNKIGRKKDTCNVCLDLDSGQLFHYTKAFNSLYHENIWKSLKEQGIEQKYIRLIKNVYSHSTARIQLEKKGTPFRVGKDDIVLFAETPENIQQMIYELAKESEKTGLKLNPEKTKVMTNGKKSTIRIGNNQIDYTDEYVYLGQLITQEDPICKEVERRIINSWKRYWSLKEIVKNKTLHINVKTKLFNTCVLPVLTYGSQTWALAQNTTRKLETCQHAMERSMLNYPREGKRKRGRPEKKWDDDIRQVAGVTWNRVAQDRREWKRLEEAFADWQTDIQNSISREHAVIAIRNANKITIMDINSRNKTMLGMTTLRPYLSYPLSDGDVLQFGDVMAIFRLFDSDDDLPLTQDVNVPETPIVARSNHRNITTIPETPEDDPFDTSGDKSIAKSTVFLEPGKFIQKSKKNHNARPTPVALNFDLNESKPSDVTFINTSNIHELETQLPYQEVDIFNAETQLPPVVDSGISKNKEVDICHAQTQVPSLVDKNSPRNETNNICNMETQLSSRVSKGSPKSQEHNIYNAETQIPYTVVDHSSCNKYESNSTNENKNKRNCNADLQNIDKKFENSEKNEDDKENLPFDEELDDFMECFQSQSLLTSVNENNIVEPHSPPKYIHHKIDESLINMPDNIMSMSVVQKTREDITADDDDDDKTDCEDDEEKQNKDFKNHEVDCNKDLDNDIADLPTQIIGANSQLNSTSCTKVLNQEKIYITMNVDLADQPTQILNEVESNHVDNCIEDLPTQILSKSSVISSPNKQNLLLKGQSTLTNVTNIDEENYYLATQDLVNDLNSPLKIANPTTVQYNNKNCNKKRPEPMFQTPFLVKKTNKIKASRTVEDPITKVLVKKVSNWKSNIPEVLSKETNVNNKTVTNAQPCLKSDSKVNATRQMVDKKEKKMYEVKEKVHRTRRSRNKSNTSEHLETNTKINQPLIMNNEEDAESTYSKNQIKKMESKHAKKNKINRNENSDKTSKKNKTSIKRNASDIDELERTDKAETTLRRSRRQRTANNKYENDFSNDKTSVGHRQTRKIDNKSCQAKHEESTVYDTSNESLSTGRKRQVSDIDFSPSTKKAKQKDTCMETKLALANRRRKLIQHVLFTALSNDKLRVKLVELGAVMVSDVQSCTVVVTEQLRRTFKLMCALGLGKPIVGHGWIQACLDARMIVDPWQHLITDMDGEKKLNFNLRQSLAAKRYFLKSYNVSCTPSVQPAPSELRMITECSGGVWREGGPRWLCVWAGADRALLPALAARGATLVARDVFLGCVMRQRLDLPAPTVKQP
ncbi:Mediator of DNA damage checkpoint protein 1 [Eumeta japonica]|uniref:Mediator of DNA damage checkpoint protein 1 n=1 Tax=Eumeta variegata TaxID=151549 RepID=A0A4C1X2V3_EUMVA|nr:Mediator of DNA damage checkpoint protein 1 [Eumeta japonica]